MTNYNNADPYKMRESHIIKPQWPLLKKMAESETIIDVYNKTSWGADDTLFNPVYKIVHTQIAPHAHHQQWTETYVKGMADQARTNVGDERRNSRICTNSYLKREYNKSVKKLSGLKEGVKQVKNALGTGHFLDRSARLIGSVKKAKRRFGHDRSKEAMAMFVSIKDKSDEKKRDEKVAAIIDSLDTTNFDITNKIEAPRKIKLTSQMGGGVSLKELTAKRGRLNHIKAELVARKLVDDPQTNRNVFVNMKVNEMKKLLKEHELRQRRFDEPKIDWQLKDITFLRPVSDEMKALLNTTENDEEDADDEEYEP
jgi:hypothetical protein